MAQVNKKKRFRKKINKSRKNNILKSEKSTQGTTLEHLLKPVKDNPHDTKSRIVLGEHYFKNSMEDKILEAVEPLEKSYPFTDNLCCQKYNRLYAFGLAYQNRWLDAEKACLRGKENEPEAFDYNFILCYLHLSLHEYDKVILFAEKYLECREKYHEKAHQTDFTDNKKYLSQIYNYIGSAYYEKGNWAQAKEQFLLSQKSDPGNQLSYINLVKIATYLKNYKTAREIVDQGINKCSQTEELRLLQKTLKNTAAISACMIVKDEEKFLPECLDSIRDWVDEIIIVDTGSTDKTLKIAKSYGAKIYHQKWEGNFSKHRNYSIEKATCDWIFIIDADERIYEEDVPMLQKIINSNNYSLISVNVNNVYGKNEDKVTFLNSTRFFKRELMLRYEGIVHNVLQIPKTLTVLRTKVRIKHLGYDLSREEMKKKIARSKPLLEKQLKENPDNVFALYNYAQILLAEGMGNWEEFAPLILKTAGRAVELTSPDQSGNRSTHLMCLNQIAMAHFYLKQYDKSIVHCEQALTAKADFLDPLLLMGHNYGAKKEYEISNNYYQKYLEKQKKFDGTTDPDAITLYHPSSISDALNGLASNAELMGDKEKAKDFYLQIYNINKGYLDSISHLGRICLGENQFDEAEKYFLEQIEFSSINALTALGLAYINLINKNEDKFDYYHKMALELDITNDQAALFTKTGRYLFQFGKVAHAVELFEKAKQLGSNDYTLDKLLADGYYNLNRYDEAVKVYQRIIEEGEESPEIINDLGNCHYQLNQLKEAEHFYKKVLQSENIPPMTFRNLGFTQARLEKPKEAINALEKYLELEPEQQNVIPIIGDLYAKLGEYNPAISYYERFLHISPNDYSVLFSISECYHLMGQRDSAILGYQRVLELNSHFEPALQKLDELQQFVAES